MIYDIIGDIHGHAGELRLLLERLGYRDQNGGYSQRNHQAIFVGDFIDRGSKIREVLTMVRSMVSSGAAVAVLGNHEFNAICYHTEDGSGDFLRSHTVKHTDQHQATIDQLVDPHPEEWQDYLDWFKRLPLFVELPGLRVVHAAWDPAAIQCVGDRSFDDDDFLQRSATRGGAEFAAVDTLLKGPEIRLPPDCINQDKEGFQRHEMRVAWWQPRVAGKQYTYTELAVPGAEEMPDDPVPLADLAACPSYGSDERPVIFGHYWFPAEAPAPLTANAACIDYSVARAGGRLVAYTWHGELTLEPDHFIGVPRLS